MSWDKIRADLSYDLLTNSSLDTHDGSPYYMLTKKRFFCYIYISIFYFFSFQLLQGAKHWPC